MPKCCAFGCRNDEHSGKILHRLPSVIRNKERRKIWIQRIRWKNWKPSEHVRLCEDHFTKDQYEPNRGDGLRRLKQNAVPSLFSHRLQPKPRKPPTIRTTIEHPKKRKKCDDCKLDQYASGECTSEAVSTELAKANGTVENAEILCSIWSPEASEENILCLQKVLSLSRVRVAKLKKQIDNLVSGVKQTFTDDQLLCLKQGTLQDDTWPQETIEKAVKLRLTCGKIGYASLQEVGQPWPSGRILQDDYSELLSKDL